MINPDRAFDQFKALLGTLGITKVAALRPLTYSKEIVVPGSTNFGAGLQSRQAVQQFPAGAIVLGVMGGAFPEGQPQNPFLQGLDRYRTRFTYNTSDGLVTDLALASAIFGRENDVYPQRALFLEANQAITIQVENLTPEQIRTTTSFHCLVWRYAQ